MCTGVNWRAVHVAQTGISCNSLPVGYISHSGESIGYFYHKHGYFQYTVVFHTLSVVAVGNIL